MTPSVPNPDPYHTAEATVARFKQLVMHAPIEALRGFIARRVPPTQQPQ